MNNQMWAARVGWLVALVMVSLGCPGPSPPPPTSGGFRGGSSGFFVFDAGNPFPTDDGGMGTSSSSSTGGVPPTPVPPCVAAGSWPSIPLPAGVQVMAAHACSPDLAWAVGTDGFITRWDGTRWTDTPSTVGSKLNDVVCVDRFTAVAVGHDGLALAWDGATWVQEDSQTTLPLLAISAGANGVQWAVSGDLAGQGQLLRRNADATWEVVTTTVNALVAVSQEPNGIVWAVGQNGTVLQHLAGVTTPIPMGTTSMFTAVHGATEGAYVGSELGQLFLVRVAGSLTESTADGLVTDVLQRGSMVWVAGEFGQLSTGTLATRTRLPLLGDETWRAWLIGDDDSVCAVSSDGQVRCFRAEDNGARIREAGAECGRAQVCAGGMCARFPEPTRSDIHAVTQAPPDTLWAVGDNGVILRNRGSAWGHVPSGTTEALHAITAPRSNAAWAVGDNGTVLRWRGSSFTPETVPTTARLTSVHASSTSDVWAVGLGGTVLQHNGRAWSLVDAGTQQDLHAVFAFGPDDVWLLGDGVALRFDGTGFRPATELPPGNHRYITAATPDAIWISSVVNNADVLLRVHAAGVQVIPLPDVGTGIHVRSAREVLVALGGGQVGRWNGSTLAIEGLGHSMEVTSVASHPDGRIWALGRQGLLQQRGAAGWQAVVLAAPVRNQAVMVLPTGDAWTVGTHVTRWNSVGGTPVSITQQIAPQAVWASRPTDVWIMGRGIYAAHWQGNGAITNVTLPLSLSIRAISGSGQFDVWAVGDAGAMLHFDGFNWSNVTAVTSSDLLSVNATPQGLTAACGTNGTLLKLTQGGITPFITGITHTLRDVVVVNDTILAVGDADSVVTVDASLVVTLLTTGTGEDLTAITEGPEAGTYSLGTASGALITWHPGLQRTDVRNLGLQEPVLALRARNGVVWGVTPGTVLSSR